MMPLAMIAEKSFAERLREGKILEALVARSLRPILEAMGNQLVESTVDEDKHPKIDRWIVTRKGKLSLQIKVRESGDDLIYEIVKNVRTWEDGRDLLCQADLYLYVDRAKTGWLYWLKDIKGKIKTLREQARKDLNINPNQNFWSDNGYEMRVTTDRFHGNSKLMAFFNPTYFPVIQKFPHLYD